MWGAAPREEVIYAPYTLLGSLVCFLHVSYISRLQSQVKSLGIILSTRWVTAVRLTDLLSSKVPLSSRALPRRWKASHGETRIRFPSFADIPALPLGNAARFRHLGIFRTVRTA